MGLDITPLQYRLAYAAPETHAAIGLDQCQQLIDFCTDRVEYTPHLDWLHRVYEELTLLIGEQCENSPDS